MIVPAEKRLIEKLPFLLFILLSSTTFAQQPSAHAIYDALFGKRQTNCVKVLDKQDAVIPKMDDAIWLEFETCPAELNRILSMHKYSAEKLTGRNLTFNMP